VLWQALQAASFHGHAAIVRLLERVNAQGGRYGTALFAALSNGSDRVVLLLLDNGADVNAEGGSYGSPLHAALFGGSDALNHLILEKGEDINARRGPYGNAAACGGSLVSG
jgi:ankyrin repeat protein